MKFIKILTFTFLLIIFNNEIELKAQTEAETLYLKSFVKFGLGKMDNHVNLGGGLFFPVSNKFLVGVRSNMNTELEMFKFPPEHLFNLDLNIRYVPIISEYFVILTGGGLGFASGSLRGKFIKTRMLFIGEYEEIKFKSLSGSAEIEIGFLVTKFFGISISGYSVITSKKNITTYQVSLFFYGLKNP
jgi:hypothetical protein